MTEEKTQIIAAICAARFEPWLMESMAKLKFAHRAGSKRKPAWAWNRDVLRRLDMDRLGKLYAQRQPEKV